MSKRDCVNIFQFIFYQNVMLNSFQHLPCKIDPEINSGWRMD